MKKLLMIAYYFPPMGMSGVQRTQKFVKFLPEFGWEPVVLTVRDVVYHAQDHDLLDEVKDRHIIRTESLDPLRFSRRLYRKSTVRAGGFDDGARLRKTMFRRLFSFVFVPDSKLFWIPYVLPEVASLLHSGSIDLLYTTSPPLSAHLAGLFIKNRVSLPWIADFRDTISEPHQGSTPVHRWLNQGIIRRIARRADHVLTVSDPITRELRLRSGTSADKFSTLPNGYDREDFTGIGEKKSTKWIWTYCGTVSPIQNPRNFLQALSMAMDRCPELSQVIRVRFVGTVVDVPLKRLIKRYNLGNVVQLVGYVSHRESIRFLMEAHILLLLLDENLSPGMVTGKVFEYLAAGKPIMAAVPKGEAERLILRFARGVVVPPTDSEKMTQQILRSFTLWKRGDLKVSVPRWKNLDSYDRKNQTGELAEIMNRLVIQNTV